MAEKLLETYLSNSIFFNKIKDNFMNWVTKPKINRFSTWRLKKRISRSKIQKFPPCDKQVFLKQRTRKKGQTCQNRMSSNRISSTITSQSQYTKCRKCISYHIHAHFYARYSQHCCFCGEHRGISEEISTFATIVPSFIALIPNIKDQVPPSQQLTLSQIITQIEALNCILSQLHNFYFKQKSIKPSIFKNPLFVISLFIHVSCFLLLALLLLFHQLSWQKLYSERKTFESHFPYQNRMICSNHYCDELFLHQNKEQTDKNSKILPYI